MTVRKLAACAAVCAAVALTALMCSEDETAVTAPSPTPDDLATYTVDGTMLILCWPDTVYVSRYCEGAALVTVTDSSAAECDTLLHEVSGNTLRLLVDVEAMNSGAVVNWYEVYTREGSGSGLQGTWNLTGVDYSVISGTPTVDELAELDEYVADEAQFIAAGWSFTLVIGSSTISAYETYPVADIIIQTMDEYIDTSMFDVTITKVNNSTVRITGNTSGEVVTITGRSNGDLVWTSSYAQHAPHTYYANPTACPNEYAPDWIEAFFMANLRLQKAVQFDLKAPALPRSISRLNPANR